MGVKYKRIVLSSSDEGGYWELFTEVVCKKSQCSRGGDARLQHMIAVCLGHCRGAWIPAPVARREYCCFFAVMIGVGQELRGRLNFVGMVA